VTFLARAHLLFALSLLPSFRFCVTAFAFNPGIRRKKQAVSLSRAIFNGAIGFSSLATYFLDARTAEEIIETPPISKSTPLASVLFSHIHIPRVNFHLHNI
jgi:hypothetical protein